MQLQEGIIVDSIRSKIKQRLQKFVELDTSGLRSSVLSFFLKEKNVTVDDLYEAIKTKFNISRSSVASMVGYIHSKLGILRAYKESYKTHMVYTLKDEYVDLIKSILYSKYRSANLET